MDWNRWDQEIKDEEEEDNGNDSRGGEEDNWNDFRGGEEFCNMEARGGSSAENTGNVIIEVVGAEDVCLAEQTMKQMEATILHR